MVRVVVLSLPGNSVIGYQEYLSLFVHSVVVSVLRRHPLSQIPGTIGGGRETSTGDKRFDEIPLNVLLLNSSAALLHNTDNGV